MLDASSAERLSDREVVFTRLVDAPRERVWMIWTDVRHLHRWWGPAGFTTTTHEFTFAPDGVWRFVMHGPDGTDYPNRIVFRELDPPARIVYENGWDLPGAPLDFTVVVSFVPDGMKTRLPSHDVPRRRSAPCGGGALRRDARRDADARPALELRG